MQIQSVKIKKLYNVLSTEAEFNAHLTMLVGINGCGKTSVLNVVDWLLRPNIKQLILTPFELIELKFTFEKISCKITATKEKNILELVIAKGSEILPPLTVNLSHTATANKIDEFNELYGGLSLETQEEETWKFLQSLPKPTVISLDRRILDGRRNRTLEQILTDSDRGIAKNTTPLEKVEEITAANYAEFRSKSIRLDSLLKSKIILSALQIPTGDDSPGQDATISEEQIAKIEEKTIRYLSATAKQNSIPDDIRRFFSFYREASKGNKNTTNYKLAKMQYKQISGLAAAFSEFETKNSEAYSKLRRYTESINSLFVDCGKQVMLNPANGKLHFEFADEYGLKKEKRSIEGLSSGEKQIVILLTYLAFVAEENGIFIVDEPEISLHLKWQREFMDSFLRVCPKNTQILIATHSPEIVGKHKESCKLLRGRKM